MAGPQQSARRWVKWAFFATLKSAKRSASSRSGEWPETARRDLLRRLELRYYDVRVGTRFKIFTNATTGARRASIRSHSTPSSFISVDTRATGRDHIIIPPNSFALAETVEEFRIPRRAGDLRRQVDLRTLRNHRERHAARTGMARRVTIEINNTTPLPAKSTPTKGSHRWSSSRPIASAIAVMPTRAASTGDQTGLTLPTVD